MLAPEIDRTPNSIPPSGLPIKTRRPRGHPAGDGGDPTGRGARCWAVPLVGCSGPGGAIELCRCAGGHRGHWMGAGGESILRHGACAGLLLEARSRALPAVLLALGTSREDQLLRAELPRYDDYSIGCVGDWFRRLVKAGILYRLPSIDLNAFQLPHWASAGHTQRYRRAAAVGRDGTFAASLAMVPDVAGAKRPEAFGPFAERRLMLVQSRAISAKQT